MTYTTVCFCQYITVWRLFLANQLSQIDWINYGLDVLEKTGHEALKADLLAKGLKVSRGSFYWHFKDLNDFHLALVTAWKEQNTEAIIADLEQVPQGHEKVEALLAHCLETELPREAAMRRWSGISTIVAKAVQTVDEVRFKFLFAVLKSQGLSDDIARERATLLLWAYIGRSFAGSFVKDMMPNAVSTLRIMLLSR